MKGYWIYQHLNKNNEIIYIGLTTDMEARQLSHKSQSSHKKEIFKIMYADAKNKTSMELYEKYYINKYNPKHNRKDARNDDVEWLKLDELSFKEYKKPKVAKQAKRVNKTKEVKEKNFYYTKFQLIDLYLDLISCNFYEKINKMCYVYGKCEDLYLFYDKSFKTCVQISKGRWINFCTSIIVNEEVNACKFELQIDLLLEDEECKQYYDKQIKKYNIIEDSIEKVLINIGDFLNNNHFEIMGIIKKDSYGYLVKKGVGIKIKDLNNDEFACFRKNIIINNKEYNICRFIKKEGGYINLDLDCLLIVDKVISVSCGYSFLEKLSNMTNNKISLEKIKEVEKDNKKYNEESKKEWEDACNFKLNNGLKIQYYNTKLKRVDTYIFSKKEILNIKKMSYESGGSIRLWLDNSDFYEFILDPYPVNMKENGFSSELLEINWESRGTSYFIANKTYDDIVEFFSCFLKLNIEEMI
jgi:predicted GIY-YIG superfamily endonuclease